MCRAIVVVCSIVLSTVASAGDKPPDVSSESEVSLHRYVGRPVVVRGRLSVRGKIAPFIKTSELQIYLKCDDPPDLDSSVEGTEGIVMGTLHYQPAIRSPDSTHAAGGGYFYLGGDCAFLAPGAI